MSEQPAVLRIFSYLPNPRVWKATIAARLGGVHVELVGAKPAELADWLWDFDARPLAEHERSPNSPYARQGRRGFGSTLYKTDEFLQAQPFATVPCAFSPDGKVGIYESNSILRAVARAAPAAGLYGRDGYSASRIDSFLDADLVFAREAQVYLLELQNGSLAKHTYERMQDAYEFFMRGVNNALQQGEFVADECLSIADIAFLCDFTQFQRELYFTPQLREQGLEPISARLAQPLHSEFSGLASSDYPAVPDYLGRTLEITAISADLQPYVTDLKGKLTRVFANRPT